MSLKHATFYLNQKINPYTPINNEHLKQISWLNFGHFSLDILLSLVGSLRNIVRCVPPRLRHTIYNVLVKPHLLYLVEIWGSEAKTKLASLQVTKSKYYF